MLQRHYTAIIRWACVDRVATMPGIKAVAGVHIGMISTPATPYFMFFGVDPREFGILHFKISQGRSISAAGRREIMLGRTAAKMLKKNVGDFVKISDGSFRIVGIFESGVSFEDGGGVMTLKEAQALSKKNGQVSMLFIRVKDVNKADILHPAFVRTSARPGDPALPPLAASSDYD